MRHTDFSLGPICSQVEGHLRCPGSGRVGEQSQPALQTHGQSPLSPARKKMGADGARDGSSRTVEGRLGRYILEAFTGTCHRSPAGADGLEVRSGMERGAGELG